MFEAAPAESWTDILSREPKQEQREWSGPRAAPAFPPTTGKLVRIRQIHRDHSVSASIRLFRADTLNTDCVTETNTRT